MLNTLVKVLLELTGHSDKVGPNCPFYALGLSQAISLHPSQDNFFSVKRKIIYEVPEEKKLQNIF